VKANPPALVGISAPLTLCLSRQNLPIVRTAHTEENLCARGAYVLVDVVGSRDITLLATGSEVQMAIEAAKLLASVVDTK
jgi:transketolase